jgi:hypothetical protein
MDLILIAVTALALAMTAGMAIVVATLLRDERARSEARVAALSAMATEHGEPPISSFAARTVANRGAIAAPVPRSIRNASIEDFEIRPVAVRDSALFAPAAQPSPWGARLGVIGTLIVVLVALGGAIMLRSTHGRDLSAAAIAAPAAEPAPLELLSLSHAQEADHIVITGLVQNPRSAGSRSHVVATAFVFGPDGAFLSSSRAPLDFTTLTPGEESRFVVSVPVTAAVSRYRIGFRTEDGQVLPHVDKRAPDALAQK